MREGCQSGKGQYESLIHIERLKCVKVFINMNIYFLNFFACSSPFFFYLYIIYLVILLTFQKGSIALLTFRIFRKEVHIGLI